MRAEDDDNDGILDRDDPDDDDDVLDVDEDGGPVGRHRVDHDDDGWTDDVDPGDDDDGLADSLEQRDGNDLTGAWDHDNDGVDDARGGR